jgi:hypothetical protein
MNHEKALVVALCENTKNEQCCCLSVAVRQVKSS